MGTVKNSAVRHVPRSVFRTVVRWIGKLAFWLVVAVALLQLWFFIQIVYWARFNPSSTSFMRIRLDELQAQNPSARLRYEWVPYERISIHLKRSVIAAEDSGFMQHQGVEWQAIQGALERNLRRGRVTHGGSTITQQLAKNLFLSPSRSYARKAQELVIAYMLEAVWGKRRILEVYLNVVEWGNGVFGAKAASAHYYGAAPANLSPYQAARLAAMLPAPRYFDKRRNSPFLARKAGTVQARLGQVVAPR
jgi:monofunctional biosynthetic peptidoglycan transglycosylase